LSGLSGVRIGLLEARMSGEMARLVEKYGGTVVSAPALREEATECRAEVSGFIDRLADGGFDFVIFQTGRGVSVLLEESEKLGRKDELVALLNKTKIVCRGPKPTAVCHRSGLPIAVRIKEPYTTRDLIEALDMLEPAKVAVLNYGERNRALADYLSARGAEGLELLLYEWKLPDEIAPLEDLIRQIVAGGITAVAFTSQIQARHLFEVAGTLGLEEELRHALRGKTLVASIGPTCSAALRAFEIEPQVEPEHPKMAHLVQALKAKFE
jgi:uroporphyrinogen-III synthase